MKRRMRKVTALVLSVGMMLSQKSAAEAEKDTLAAKLNSIIDQMNKTQEELSTKETEISTAEEELVQAKVDEDDQYNSMKKRIKFMYEGGNTQFLEILMSSSNIGDLLNKAEYVSKLSSYDRDMLVAFQETVKVVEEKEAKLKDEYAAAAAKKNNSGSSSNGSSSSRPASSGNVVSGSGYFTHPCPGMTYQSSYFGEVRSFDSRPHKGNDYAAPTGTPTYAAAAGTVITAGWSNSAGNWVVISHGNGLVTKYMHHSSICVSAGQRVAKGQQIGYVGSTGYSTGAHLHFQVELNGTPVNPNNYM